MKKGKLTLSFMKVIQLENSDLKRHNYMRSDRMKRNMIEHNKGIKRTMIGYYGGDFRFL